MTTDCASAAVFIKSIAVPWASVKVREQSMDAAALSVLLPKGWDRRERSSAAGLAVKPPS